MYYDSQTTSDYVEVMIQQLGSPSQATRIAQRDAAEAINGCRAVQQRCVLVSRLPAINGVEVDTTTPASDGTFDHSVLGSKGSYVFTIDDWTHAPQVDPRVAVLARAQYQKILA